MRITSIVIAKVVLCLGLAGPVMAAEQVDLLIQNGVIYDGSGGNPVKGDVAVRGGRVVAVGKLADYQAKQKLDAKGLAVAPGFINTLSWATESLTPRRPRHERHQAGRDAGDFRRRHLDGAGERHHPRGDDQDPNATSATTSPGRRWANIWISW